MKNFSISDLLATVPGITSEPQIIEKYVDNQINYRLGRLRKCFGLKSTCLDDVRQTFLLALVSGINNYDPEKSTWRTFVTAILNNCYRNQLRQLEAKKRLAVKCTVQIEDLDEDHDLTPGYVQDFNTPMDVAEIIANMPPELQCVAELLKEYSPAEASRILKIGKSTVTRRIKRIREYFVVVEYEL